VVIRDIPIGEVKESGESLVFIISKLILNNAQIKKIPNTFYIHSFIYNNLFIL